MSGKIYSGKEVAEHSSKDSCWIIVHGTESAHHTVRLANTLSRNVGKVYDVTEFLDGTFYLS